jgi:hypothetical protein
MPPMVKLPLPSAQKILIVLETRFATTEAVSSRLKRRLSLAPETTTAQWVCSATLALHHVLIVYQTTTVTLA